MNSRNNSYWEARTTAIMDKQQLNADITYRKLRKAYIKAIAEIEVDVKKIYNKLKKNGELNDKQVKEFLNAELSKLDRNKLKKLIDNTKDENLRKFLTAKLDAPAYAARIARRESLKETLIDNLKKIMNEVAVNEITLDKNLFIQNMNESYYTHMWETQRGMQIGFDVGTLGNETIDAILKRPFVGSNFSQRIWGNTTTLTDQLYETMLSGFLNGKPLKKMIEELVERMEVGESAARRLVRTESAYYTNMAAVEGYKECGIEKYIYFAKLDLKVSNICRELDGKIFPIKEALSKLDRKELKKLILNTKDDKLRKFLTAKLDAPAYAARIARKEVLKGALGKETIEAILKRPFAGGYYSERIWGNTSKLTEQLYETVLSGLLNGKPLKKMINELTETMEVGESAARRLVRTESAYYTNMAAVEGYKECGIEKYRYYAKLDLKVSNICRELDGKIFPIKEAQTGINLPPMHPWCRSSIGPVIDGGVAQRIGVRTRDVVTGQSHVIKGDITYKDWYDRFVIDKYGVDKAKELEKQIKNSSNDKKQFEKYKKLLAKDLPKTLKEFQEIKYNNSDEWNKIKRQYLDANRYNKIVNNATNLNIKGIPIKLNIKGIPIKNIERINLKDFEFDYYHINNERSHGVTKEMAQSFINNSKAAYSRWNGQVIVYVSEKGCSVVNLKEKKVSTSYKSDEYDNKFKMLMEVLKDD